MVACHLRNCARCVERLDSAPDGWRRCALAFLEAQSWGEAFRNLDGASRERSLALSGLRGPRAGTSCLCRPPRPGERRAGGRDRPLRVFPGLDESWLEHPRQARGGSRRDGLAQPGGASRIGDPGSPATKTPGPGTIAGLPTDRVPTVREVARLRIGTGDQATAEVPILAGPGISGRWLMEQPPPVSEHDRAVWQRQGYQLEQRRRLVSVPLADGRRAAVPVDHVQVRYIGHDPL